MKKLLALGLAATLATASVAATAGAALAQPKGGPGWNDNWKKNNWRWHRGHRGYDGGFLLPFVLGGAIGYGLSQSYPGPYYDDYDYAYGDDARDAWCAAHFRTYNPVTNTYWVRPGVPRVCVPPYG
jgi:hypothetical protein